MHLRLKSLFRSSPGSSAVLEVSFFLVLSLICGDTEYFCTWNRDRDTLFYLCCNLHTGTGQGCQLQVFGVFQFLFRPLFPLFFRFFSYFFLGFEMRLRIFHTRNKIDTCFSTSVSLAFFCRNHFRLKMLLHTSRFILQAVQFNGILNHTDISP